MMSHATFRFDAELNDFLPPRRRNNAVIVPFSHRASIKDMIEALGVPHPEIAVILVNATPVSWSYIVQDQDIISVYPASTAPNVLAACRVGPPPLDMPRFVLDVHLGKLAAYLRLLGFDTLYRADVHDAELARISADEQRILLTRDRHLLKRSIVTHGYFVRATDPRQQVVEIVRRFDLAAEVAPFQRCSRCNGLLHPVDKAHTLPIACRPRRGKSTRSFRSVIVASRFIGTARMSSGCSRSSIKWRRLTARNNRRRRNHKTCDNPKTAAHEIGAFDHDDHAALEHVRSCGRLVPRVFRTEAGRRWSMTKIKLINWSLHFSI